MTRFSRTKSFVDAFLRRKYKGTPLQDVGSPLQDAMSRLHKAASPLQDDGLWYRVSQKVKEAMESMDNDIMMGQDVDTHRVNSLLRDLLATENHSCVKRIHYYLDTKRIEPDEETLGLMMNIYDERKEFVEANSMLKKAKEYHLLPSADMYNFSISGFFQMGDYKQGWVVYAQMISSGIKPTSETFSLLIRYCSKTEGETEKYLNMMQQQGVQPTVDTLGDAIDAFMAVGSVEKAKKVLLTTKLQESCYNEAKGTLVSSLAKFGYVDDALEIYKEIKSGKHHPIPTSTLALIENIRDPKHATSFDELLADLTDYQDWDEACANIILWCTLNQKIDRVCEYVRMRAMKWPESNICEMMHFLDKAFHKLEQTHTDFGKEIIAETTLIPGCTLSRRGLDCFLSICYRRSAWMELKWVAQHYDTCDLPHNVMNYLSTFKAMLACGEPEIAEAISSNIDAAHDDSYLKKLFDKNVNMIKQGYQEELIETEEFALRHVF